MARKNEYGVDALKRGLTQMAVIAKAVDTADRNDDGEIDASERNALFGTALTPLLLVAQDYQNIANEVSGGEQITDEEAEELIQHLQGLDFLDVDKDDTEAFIKDTILWLNYNRRYTQKAIDFVKSKQA